MNSNTLAIFAIVAVLGLTAAAFVVIPSMPVAKAFDLNKFKNYGSQAFSGHNIPNKC